ncbi:MFS transporter [Methylobacterium sp. 17Sr1-1]|uniref:MFS transporter n=1 Tax=Methylobacterium sp. 17Sr1-1 TaxID=2202826 RepID=UPI000D6F2720|nr:MFS transporter [Methylobacterium sp. 17Sr1-1]AWN55653.1 MFS transporter [Methylobacterium sp. 17Sr1-1]
MAETRSATLNRPATPLVVYSLGLTIFALTTSEFMVAGMMPALSVGLGSSVAKIGYLIALYAVAMAVGGPLVTALLLHARAPDKPALLVLLILYVAGGVLAAVAPGYGVMAVARVVTGATSAACFGVALTVAAGLAGPEARGRAASIVLGGLMLAPVLGLPVTTWIGQTFGWRASFWSVAGLSALCTAIVLWVVPSTHRREAQAGLAPELAALKSRGLWAAYATSGLIIGATFAAFSYAGPLLVSAVGFPESALPILLAVYGVANVVGNLIVGRFADRYTMPILAGGLVLLSAALAAFGAFASHGSVALTAFLVIGLVGVPMNPAMVARVMRAAHPGALVNTMHTSVITTGLAFGTWAGGAAIDAGFRLTAPLWIGFVLALLGLASLLAGRAAGARRMIAEASPRRSTGTPDLIR